MEFLKENWYFLLGSVLGVLLIVIGIALNVKEKNKLNHILTATVSNCIETKKLINSMYMTCYEVFLNVPTGDGVITKSIFKGKEIETGTKMEVYYDEAKNRLEQVSILEKNVNTAPTAFAIIGGLLTTVMVTACLIREFSFSGAQIALLIGALIGIMFFYCGILCLVIVPAKRLTKRKRGIRVPGVLVDYYTVGGNVLWPVCAPVFSYYYNGEMRMLRSDIAGNSKKYRKLGRKVTIVIDEQTEEAYCTDSTGTIIFIGLCALIVGILLVIVMMYYMFTI